MVQYIDMHNMSLVAVFLAIIPMNCYGQETTDKDEHIILGLIFINLERMMKMKTLWAWQFYHFTFRFYSFHLVILLYYKTRLNNYFPKKLRTKGANMIISQLVFLYISAAQILWWIFLLWQINKTRIFSRYLPNFRYSCVESTSYWSVNHISLDYLKIRNIYSPIQD